MTKAFFLLALAVGYLAYQRHEGALNRASARAYDRAVASGTDPCAGKQTCAVVYMAPWCPSCRQEAPQLRDALARASINRKLGLRVVVGQGRSRADDEEMARGLGAGAVVDADGAWHRKLNVQAYPSFFVLDGEQAVILSGNEAYQWVREKF